jgi:psp operon transcriptional activator
MVGNPQQPPSLIGTDPAFLAVLEQVSRLAPLDRPALVIGERGTGKELIAERMHYLSRRWDGPFVKVNCAALSETLLETELFGHEAGAFTGARNRHRGRFERADGGTLFLDEIATASARVQEQVLRVIEYGEYERVGGERVMTTDVRVIAATNVDLPALAAEGGFRADLLDRLAFDVVTLPPLRARPADILDLANAFGLAMAKALGLPLFPGFSHACEAKLLGHDWPGNVRELRNVVERAVYRAEGETPIDAITLDPFESPWRPGGAAPATAPEPALPQDFTATVAAFEADLVRRAMAAAEGNQSEAAQRLGLGYHQFRRLLRKYPGSP